MRANGRLLWLLAMVACQRHPWTAGASLVLAGGIPMAWKKPKIVEISLASEINSYASAEIAPAQIAPAKIS